MCAYYCCTLAGVGMVEEIHELDWYVLCNTASYFQYETIKSQGNANSILEVTENSIELFTVIFQVDLFETLLLMLLLLLLSTYF